MYKHNQGFAALLTIVIIGAAALIMGMSASLLGLGELDQGFIESQAGEVLSLADGCMDEALRRISLDNGYVGGSLSLGDGSCIIGVQSALSDRTVTVDATLGSYTRSIEASITIDTDGSLISHSWQEL